MKHIVAAILLFVCCSAWAQHGDLKTHPSRIDGKTVSFTEFIEYIESETGWVVITDVKVKYMQDPDEGKGMDKWWLQGGHPIKIKANHVSIHNCTFDDDYWLVLRDIDFEGYLAFVSCKNLKVLIRDSRFRAPMRVSSTEAEFLKFTNCQFDLGLKIDRSTISDQILIDSCKFHLDSAHYFSHSNARKDFDRDDYMLQVRNTKDPVKLSVTNTTFTTNVVNQNSDLTVRLNDSKFSGLNLYRCTFGTNLTIDDSSIENQFTTTQCVFNKGVLIGGLNINQSNSVIDWESLKDYKLAIINMSRDSIFNGLNEGLFRGDEHYADLISCYSNLYYTFKTQGNRFFANKCYIEWKNIETKQQLYKFSKTGDSSYKLLYLLNELLRIFCDYGTNPIKSLYNSGLVMLVFAGIFFLFYDDAKLNGRTFYSHLAFLSNFHRAPDRLEDIYRNHSVKFIEPDYHAEDIAVVRQNISGLPFYYKWFTTRILPDNLLDKLELRIYRAASFKNKSWELLTRWQKFKLNSIIFLLLIGSFSWLVFERALSSVIISINAFSTLGFGEIRVKGWAIYLTVIEGFIGWFLLSLFSVSLLNQLLQ